MNLFFLHTAILLQVFLLYTAISICILLHFTVIENNKKITICKASSHSSLLWCKGCNGNAGELHMCKRSTSKDIIQCIQSAAQINTCNIMLGFFLFAWQILDTLLITLH